MKNPIRFASRTHAILLIAMVSLPWSQSTLAQSTQADAPSALTVTAKDAERNTRQALRDDALAKLYKLQPEAQKAVEGSVGYAVFDINSVYAILFVGQKGKGLLVDNASKKTTYMSSNRVGTGPGVGKQRVFQVFVFKNKSAMEQFVVAGGMGGDLGASASAGTDGMVKSFNPNIDIYQIPESGVAVQASWGGTIYSLDKDLN